MTWSITTRARVYRLRAARSDAYAALGAFGLTHNRIREYMGPRLKELEQMAALDESVMVTRWGNRPTYMRACDVLHHVTVLASAETELAELRARRRHERGACPDADPLS